MSTYQKTITGIDPTVNAAQVENWMLDEFRTLCHLPRSEFVRQVKLFKMAWKTHPDEMKDIYG